MSIGLFARDGPNPRFVLSANVQGGHRHVLDSTNPSRQRPWRMIAVKESERAWKAFVRLTSKANHSKGPQEELVTADGVQKARPNLENRYGQRWKVIGKGAYGTVRIHHRRAGDVQTESLFAVKEFHRKIDQTPAHYSRRILAEFTLARNLQHTNVVCTLDLLQDHGTFFEVMEYCAAGTLSSLIEVSGPLGATEADCFFKQLVRGVEYLHDVGVAHCDLKPENLLLTPEGGLKISDFGCSQWMYPLNGDELRMLSGIRGSRPYIAPEEYTATEFDGRAVDVWACGVIYMFMRLFRHLWYSARDEDEYYVEYVEGRRVEAGYAPVEALEPEECRIVIYCILDPMPGRRLTVRQFLKSDWGRSIGVCEAGLGP